MFSGSLSSLHISFQQPGQFKRDKTQELTISVFQLFSVLKGTLMTVKLRTQTFCAILVINKLRKGYILALLELHSWCFEGVWEVISSHDISKKSTLDTNNCSQINQSSSCLNVFSMLAYFELSWVHNIQTGKSGKSACLFPDQFKLVLKTTLCSEWKLFCISIDNYICLCKMRQRSIHCYKLCRLLLFSTSSANSYLMCSFSFI